MARPISSYQTLQEKHGQKKEYLCGAIKKNM